MTGKDVFSTATSPSNARIGRLAPVLLCALLGTLLAGCAVAPLPDLKAPVPEAWRNAPANAAPPAADLRGWWQALGDPALDGLIDRALRNNLDVAQAAERLQAARQVGGHARDGYLPNLHARTNDVVNPDTSASYFMVGFDSSWEFPLFGAWQSTKRVATGQTDGAQAALRGAQVSLVAEVTRRWVELRSAQRQEALLLAIRDAQQEKQRLLQTRVDLKLAPPMEAARAQAELARAEAALAEPRQAINASAQQLAVLLGQNEPDQAWLEPGTQPRLGAWQLTAAPADMLRARPEIAGAEAEVIRAAGELGLARKDIYPHIGFGSSIQWSVNIATNHRARNHEGIFSAGPVIDIPLFDWGQRHAVEQVRDAELKASLLAYRQAVIEGVAEVEGALAALHAQGERSALLARNVAAMAAAADGAATLQRLGLADRGDLGAATTAKIEAQGDLVQAQQDRSIAFIALYKALGGAPLPSVPSAEPAQ